MASSQDLLHILQILDDFSNEIHQIYDPKGNHINTTAQKEGEKLLLDVLKSDKSAVLVADTEDRLVGIATVHLVPQLRRGQYFAEIEELYVKPEFRTKGVASDLIKETVLWARSKNASCIRVESGLKLPKAHSFYLKSGFVEYAKTFKFGL